MSAILRGIIAFAHGAADYVGEARLKNKVFVYQSHLTGPNWHELVSTENVLPEGFNRAAVAGVGSWHQDAPFCADWRLPRGGGLSRHASRGFSGYAATG